MIYIHWGGGILITVVVMSQVCQDLDFSVFKDLPHFRNGQVIGTIHLWHLLEGEYSVALNCRGEWNYVGIESEVFPRIFKIGRVVRREGGGVSVKTKGCLELLEI